MINLVIALVTEARPLIDHFSLRERNDSRGFRVYQGDDMRLVITGLGKTAAAAGTAYLGGFAVAGANEAWLNVGAAGHAQLNIGEGVHALRISDAATGRNWYPPQIVSLPGTGSTFLTVDQPEHKYNKDVVYEMECAAYYPAALHFSVRELVQSYKVISDNSEEPADTVNKKKVRELIRDHMHNIADIAQELSGLAQELQNAAPKLADFDHFVERWHFTVAQEHELRSVLQQWAARAPDLSIWNETINRCPSARSVLAELKERIDTLPVRLTADN